MSDVKLLLPPLIVGVIAAAIIWKVQSACEAKHCAKGKPALISGACICVERAEP